jgi:hypothetical protein
MMSTFTTSQGHAGRGIIKTIILPNEEINRLGVESEELGNHLNSEKALYEEYI